MFVQLNPPIPLHVEGKGKGLAFAVIDYGPEHNLIWVTAIDDSSEIWCVPNPQARMQANWTLGRAPVRPAGCDDIDDGARSSALRPMRVGG